jgi:hypothetical protein
MANQIYENWTIAGAGVYDNTFGSIIAKNAICLLAQSFTVGYNGTNESFILQQVDLRIQKVLTPAADLQVEIWSADSNGMPTTLLANTTITQANISTADSYKSITGWAGTTLSASGKYALVIYHTDASAANHVRWIGTDLSNNYGVDSDTDVIGAAWIKKQTGESTWTRETSGNDPRDFNFILYGKPWVVSTTTYEEVLAKAGGNANATGKDVDHATLYIRQAENTLNARTRFNWTDNFASLSVDVKYIVSNAISSMAAIDIINYNMAGFTTRLEAEDMKKTLRENVEILVKELKDRKRQTWMDNEA